jgi:serine protease AprX
VPGSYLDQRFPDRVVLARNGASYFRLTGTSMATPIVAGAAALLLQRQPGLQPDQVKALLTGTAKAYGQSSGAVPPDPAASGSGLLDAYAAWSNLAGDAIGRSDAAGDDAAGDDAAWSDAAWDDAAWDDAAWDDAAWDDAAWDDAAWDSFAID